MTSTATANLTDILTEARVRNKPLVLSGVSWDGYLKMLDLIGERHYPRLTFCDGILKIVGRQTFWHENTARFLFSLISMTSLRLRVKAIVSGSMTLISKRHRKGSEPDESFYVQNADKFPNKNSLFNED